MKVCYCAKAHYDFHYDGMELRKGDLHYDFHYDGMELRKGDLHYDFHYDGMELCHGDLHYEHKTRFNLDAKPRWTCAQCLKK